MLEQVHQFNETMIAEINTYEAKCIDSFGKRSSDFKHESKEFLQEINNFYIANTAYLNEFKIDEAKVQVGLDLADNYLKIVKKEELRFTHI